MIIKKDDLFKQKSQSIELSDGLYSSSIVGFMVSKRTPYNDPDGDPYDAVRFCFQLEDDAGNIKCVQSPDYRLSFSEKSNFYKQLASWSKASSPENLWDRMEQAGFISDDGFNLDKFLGMHIGLMTAMTASKKDASKLYPVFTWVPAKKNAIFEAQLAEDGKNIPLWIPEFIPDEDVVELNALNGFEWKRYEEKEEKVLGDPEVMKNIKSSSRQMPDWAEAQKTESENTETAPETAEDNKAAPKLKVRTRASKNNSVDNGSSAPDEVNF